MQMDLDTVFRVYVVFSGWVSRLSFACQLMSEMYLAMTHLESVSACLFGIARVEPR
jgi:hypothetical protein